MTTPKIDPSAVAIALVLEAWRRLGSPSTPPRSELVDGITEIVACAVFEAIREREGFPPRALDVTLRMLSYVGAVTSARERVSSVDDLRTRYRNHIEGRTVFPDGNNVFPLLRAAISIAHPVIGSVGAPAYTLASRVIAPHVRSAIEEDRGTLRNNGEAANAIARSLIARLIAAVACVAGTPVPRAEVPPRYERTIEPRE